MVSLADHPTTALNCTCDCLFSRRSGQPSLAVSPLYHLSSSVRHLETAWSSIYSSLHQESAPWFSGQRSLVYGLLVLICLFKMGETTHGLRAAHRQTLGWTSPASWTTPPPASHPPFTWSYFNLWTPASTSEILPGTYFTLILQHLHHRPLPRSNLLPLGF